MTSNVIKYREAYGGEVGNKRWLSQFANKNSIFHDQQRNFESHLFNTGRFPSQVILS